MNSLYKSLIDKKKNPMKEWQIFLFSSCNISCSFCFFTKEQLKDFTGIDTIIFQAFKLIDEVKLMLSKETFSEIQLNIMGGELFSDKINDKYFKDYYEYCNIIKTSLPNLKIKFVFITNLIYLKYQRVLDLYYKLKENNFDIHLGTSFDFAGRFNRKTKEIFHNNLINNFPFEILNNISIVLTKQNIKAFLEDKDEYFKEYYNKGYSIFADYYSPDSTNNSKRHIPSDLDIYNFLTFAKEKYPNIYPVRDFIQNDINLMTCRQSMTLSSKDSSCSNCRSLTCSNKDFTFEEDYDKHSNLDMESEFLKKYNCLSCQYFSKCGLGCFLSNSYKIKDTLDYCVYKRFFSEL